MLNQTADRYKARLRWVSLALAATCVTVSFISLFVLYHAALDGQKARLLDNLRNQINLMTSISQHARADEHADEPWQQAALQQIRLALSTYNALGDTGEFVIASRDGDVIDFKHYGRAPSVGSNLLIRSDDAKASDMRKALAGKTGVSIETDYQGQTVLAAYQPFEMLGMGAVAKISVAELQRPYFFAAAVALFLTIVAVSLGTALCARAMRPMMHDLVRNETRYRNVVSRMGGGVLIMQPVSGGSDFRVVEANEAAELLDGWCRDDMIGHRLTRLFPNAREFGIVSAAYQAQQSGESVSLQGHFYQDGRISCWRNHHFLPLPTGEMVYLYEDVTTDRAAQMGLQMAATVFQHASEGIVVTDARGYIQRVNPAFTEITGYTADEAVGKTPAMLRSQRQDEQFYRTMWSELTAKGRWEGEIWNRRKNGEAYLEWLAINSVRDEHGTTTHYVAVFHDLSELHEKEQHIRQQNYRDALTGLANRHLLLDRLNHALAVAERQSQKVAVLYLDLDRFKLINDSLGHDVGDALLKSAALRLKSSLRRADTVARLGGDEFAILCINWDDPSDVVEIAEKIIELLTTAFTVASHTLHVGVSIGIALYPDDAADAKALLKNADTAMYAIKNAGGNGFRFFTRTMNDQAVERLVLENAMRLAIEKQEFKLHYQPKFHLHDGTMTGMEALVRWNHPQQGMISPAKFIPLAEETGLVLPLGDWVVQEACRQIKSWRQQGLRPGPVAVNVSARQLAQKTFARRVASILDEFGLEPAAIDLEITETAIMTDPELAAQQLEALSEFGVRIALDDFGVGQSSLGYLKRLPISVLKMDRSFIHDVIDDPDAAKLADGIIKLAHALNIEVVAEGVETQQQVEFLQDSLCDVVQGYFYARPLSADQLQQQFLIQNDFA